MIFKHSMRRNAVKLVGERSSSLDLARGRLVLISVFFALVYVLLAVRAFDLSVIQGELSSEQNFVSISESMLSENNQPKIQIIRSNIRDRNGVLLASTLKTASLHGDPSLILNPESVAGELMEIFPDLSYGKVLRDLQSSKRFVWIKRNISPNEQYAVLELGQPGLIFDYESRRFYPQGALVAHLVGYTDVDNQGLSGVERSFDRFLNAGKDLNLTIDIRLQHALRREIKRAAREFKALAGMGIIMDVRNGEVLAGVSWPDFNPHNPGGAKKEELFNRITLGVYELGSVFKIFSTAAFVETHDLPMSTTFDVREPIRIGRFTINDYHSKNRILTVPEVFMYSSNIGAAMMGEAVGTENLQNFYRDLGLLTPMEFEIGEIARPIVPYPWRDINTLTASYGHGIATTPLQLVSAVSSIVNGGYLVKPELVIYNNNNSAARAGESKYSEVRVISAQTSHRMRQLLRLVVTDGTGSMAVVSGYRVGGKTGTADKAGKGGYDRGRLISSFIGVFPMDAPRYAVFIAIDEPKGNKASFNYATGGWVAAPAVARVIASMASILGIKAEPVAADQDLGASLKQYVNTKHNG